MGHLLTFVVGVGGIVAAIATSLLVDECKAWLPTLTGRMIDYAVRWLPADQRARYSEEWRCHLNEIPGSLTRLFCAVDFSRAAMRISKISCERAPELSENHSSAKPGTAVSLQIVFGKPVRRNLPFEELVDKGIEAARHHTVKIGNYAYYNAQIGTLAKIFKPQCENWAQRGILEAKLMASLNEDHTGQATAVKNTIIRTLRSA